MTKQEHTLEGFEEYMRRKGRPPSLLMQLRIGDFLFLPETYSKRLYNRIRNYKQRHGMKFEYKKIENGIIIRRKTGI